MVGFIYFHQGWSDIINCLSLIDYYKKTYDFLYIIIRNDAKKILEEYIFNKKNIFIIPIITDNGRYYGNINDIFSKINFSETEKIDLLFHGEHDVYRKDNFNGVWNNIDKELLKNNHFNKNFYILYNIDFAERVNSFNIIRNEYIEEKTYNDFIKIHGENYVLYHDDEYNHLNGIHHISTKILFINKIEDVNYVNLNKKSDSLFDFIKILMKSKEIHLIDSLWACFCYQLDSKYHLFKDKNIYLYPKRGHLKMFTEPIHLENWNIVI